MGGGGGVVGDPPSSPKLGETLGIKGTMSLRVLLPQSCSHLVGYENNISRKEIYSIDPTLTITSGATFPIYHVPG